MARNAYTPCDDPSGCDRSPATGHPLYRVNAKGEPGDFRCFEHANPSPSLREVTEAIRDGGPEA